MAELMIDGPVGQLDAHLNEAESQHVAVLCHPHPQYGGSMNDRVLDAVERGLEDAGIACLKFNFRGIGRSEGAYDNGVGEVEDVKAVVSWARTQLAPDHLLLGGYSFGGAMALAAAPEIECDRLILIAPAIGIAGEVSPPAQPAFVFIGTDDQFIPVSTVTTFFEPSRTRVNVVEGADHFFMGAHDTLIGLVSEQLSAGA